MPLRPIQNFAAFAATLFAALFCIPPAALRAEPAIIPPGSLITPKGICPLKHTSVDARITGPLARVTVRQEF
jgi:hypothetical protein